MAPKWVEKGPNRPAGQQPWCWPAGARRAFLVENTVRDATFFKKIKSYALFTHTTGKLYFRTSTKNDPESVTFKLGPLEPKEKKTSKIKMGFSRKLFTFTEIPSTES